MEAAVGFLFELCDPVVGAEGEAVLEGFFEALLLFAAGFVEEFAVAAGAIGELVSPGVHHEDEEGVGLAGEVGMGGGEWEIGGVGDEAGGFGVEVDVAHGIEVVGGVEDAGMEAGLEEVAGASGDLVEVLGPPGMDAEEEAADGEFVASGDEEEVDVVIHDAIAVDFDALLFGD